MTKPQGGVGDRVHIPHEADRQPHGRHGIHQSLQGDPLSGLDRVPHVPGKYRVSHLLIDFGWVDFDDMGVPLPNSHQSMQNQASPNLPNPVDEQMGQPAFCRKIRQKEICERKC